MKVEISIEDSLMVEADAAAQELGMSRSALFAEALHGYLLRRRKASVTRQLNEVYKDGQDDDEQRFTQAIKNFARREAW